MEVAATTSAAATTTTTAVARPGNRSGGNVSLNTKEREGKRSRVGTSQEAEEDWAKQIHNLLFLRQQEIMREKQCRLLIQVTQGESFFLFFFDEEKN